MDKGSLRRVFDYYADQAWFGVELDRLIPQFFDVSGKEALKGLSVEEDAEGLLNEWLLFDAVLSNGKTMLQDFYERNPYHWPQEKMVLYDSLAKTNHYGFFETMAVREGEGLSLREVHSDETYDIRERSATYSLKPGYFFHGRVGKIGDHWELVGADSPAYPMQMTQRYRKVMRDPKVRLTPKDTYHLIAARSGRVEEEFPISVDPAAARARLERFLKRHKLDQYVTMDSIVRWIRTSADLDAVFESCSLLYGLLLNGHPRKNTVNELISATSDVCNSTPRDVLGGLSPNEKVAATPNWQPQFISDIRSLGGEVWLDKVEEAHEAMHAEQYGESLRAFRETFTALYDERTTRTDIYRIYANTAVVYFALGQKEEGAYMVALALALNPNYDFAQKLKQQHKLTIVSGESNFPEPPTKRLHRDPAVQYFSYLRERGISLVTKQQTKSKLTGLIMPLSELFRHYEETRKSTRSRRS